MEFFKSLLLFLFLNFGALGLGSWLMGYGPNSQWYLSLNKAPWTPPGWVFGAAWATIMICFAIYLAYIETSSENRSYLWLFAIQWVLNVSWNLLFFKLRMPTVGLIVICLLTVVVFTFLIKYFSVLNFKSLLIAPYAIWICIAVSLNAYIVFKN